MPLFSVLFALVLSPSFAQGTIRAALPIGLPPPLFIATKDAPTGVMPEYIAAVAEHLGRKHSVIPVARHRLPKYLEGGKVDFLCYTHPTWSPIKDKLEWSLPLFIKREILVGPAPLPKKISELKGKTIGATLNYSYPKLDPFFSDKTLIREDAPTDEANLQKLLSNRVVYVVTDEILLDFFKTKHKEIEIGRERLFLHEYAISCSISPKGTVTKKDLNQAIQKLKASKKLEALFAKYGVNAQIP